MRKSDRPSVGVDLGGTNIAAGVVDPRGRVLGRAKVKTRAEDGADAVVARIGKVARDAMAAARLDEGDVLGLGVGAPGAVDMGRGLVLDAPNLRWTRFPLARALAREFRTPVVVDNDANVAAWGEHVAGAARAHSDLIGIWVGTGIGAGIVLGGRVYYGHHFTSGEIGHTVIHADAPPGRRTLENTASRTAVAAWLTQLVMANRPSVLPKLVDGNLSEIRSRTLARAVELDDALTVEVLRRAAHYVAVAAANAVTLLSLPCVVVGGGVTEALGEKWIGWIRASFDELVFPRELRSCRVVAARLGDDAGLVGAAMLAREAALRRQSP